jgi:hypothetical protein
MTSTTDASPPADDSGVTSQEPKNSQSRPSRLNQALAWVGIVAGGLFIVAAIFFSGFFLSSSLAGPWNEHMGSGAMACCSQMKPGDQMMKPDEHMKPGAMMGPGGQMTPGGMMSPGSHMTPGEMMPGGMMGPAAQSPTTSPSIPRR